MAMTGRAFLRAGAVLMGLVAGLPAAAQSPFSPAFTVNDQAISYFELDQRRMLLELFRVPGDPAALAREGLIDDSLKMQALARAGLQIEEASLRAAMEEFAGRANLTLEQFLALLGQNGVEEESLRDYVLVGVSWRDYIRSRFGDQVTISEADIDQALGQSGGGTTIEVLLSEIIIPAPPPQADRAMAVAQDIAQMTSTAAFEAAAREYSALPSRAQGGRLDWLPIANYPASLRPIILALGPGDVTPPLPIEGGVALFQMRDVREVDAPEAVPAEIDYAVYHAADAAEVADVLARIDTCDDLYGVAFGLPADRLERVAGPPEAIAEGTALLLSGLDPNEAVPALGNTVVMLCTRSYAPPEEVDRDAVRNQLRGQRLAGYADALLAELRAAAVIVDQ